MHNRLKNALKTLNLGYREAGEKLNMKESSIKHLATGRKRITPEIAKEIESSLGISSIFIVFGTGGMFDKESGALSRALGDETGSRIQIPYYSEVKASTINGYTNDSNSQVEVISLPKIIVDKKINTGKIDAIKVHGDSMYPTLKEQDIIFVTKTINETIDNKIYVIRYNEEIKIKRIFKRMNQKVLLRSDNDIYPDEEVEIGENGIAIIGQVVYNMADLS